jgi:prepilin-type processing-associated H-X9-DG protein
VDPLIPELSILETIYQNGANVAFCDGHVEYDKTAIWIKPIESARMRWNNDDQPHPETW